MRTTTVDYRDINPRWSHNGRRIAFLRASPDHHLQLFVTDPGLSRPLPQFGAELVSPDRPYDPDLVRYCSPDTLAWSPDDRKIAFERLEWFTFDDGERLPGTGLWSLDTLTESITPLALHPKRYANLFYFFHTPQWSPDSRYFAFVGEGINGQRVIFVRSLAAQTATEAVPRFDSYQDSDWPTWQPQRGRKPGVTKHRGLVFRQGIVHPLAGSTTETLRYMAPGGIGVRPGEIWRIGDRDYARELYPAAAAPSTVAPRAGHLAWSANGQRLAFTLTPDATDYTRYEIWVMNGDGSSPRRVSPRDGHGYIAPVWIDASRLGALTRTGDRYSVVVVDIPTRSTHRLGVIYSADCDWSPDRARIVYAMPDGMPTDHDRLTTLRVFETHLKTPEHSVP